MCGEPGATPGYKSSARDRALRRAADEPDVFPEHTASVLGFRRAPPRQTFGEFRFAHLERDRPLGAPTSDCGSSARPAPPPCRFWPTSRSRFRRCSDGWRRPCPATAGRAASVILYPADRMPDGNGVSAGYQSIQRPLDGLGRNLRTDSPVDIRTVRAGIPREILQNQRTSWNATGEPFRGRVPEGAVPSSPSSRRWSCRCRNIRESTGSA